jgi:polygalacturonase
MAVAAESRRRWFRRVSAGILTPGLLAAAPQTAEPAQGIRTYNILDFGAKGDGKTLDTRALQDAIDACHKDRGGTVLVPAGEFVIGTVEIRSNVTLRIAAQGTLLGSADGKQYHAADKIPLRGDSTLGDGNVGLIFAVDAENVTIEGPGTIDGQGAQFRSPSRGVPPPSGRGGADRPYHLLFHRCRNLRVRGLNLVASAFHSVRAIQSHFVWMDSLRIYNRVNGNNDGFHFISCENVHVSNCDVLAQDDACALFGSCKNINIANSTFSTRWAIFRFGGGNPENVTVSNCVIHHTYGCPIKIHFGPGSQAQNLLFSNLVMQDVTGPISINVSNRARSASEAGQPQKGFVRNIMFQNIRASVIAQGKQYEDIAFPQNYRPGETRQCVVLNAIGDAVLEDISFSDVRITYEGGGTAEEAARAVPEVAGEYFEIGTPPAYGLYARNVQGLNLQNVKFDLEKADVRPAVVLDHVSGATFNGITVQGDTEAAAVVRLNESRDVLIAAARLTSPAKVFLRVEGAGSESITLESSDVSRAANTLALGGGAGKNAVRSR